VKGIAAPAGTKRPIITAGWGLSKSCPLPGVATKKRKKGMIHLLDHAFFNCEGQRSLSLLALLEVVS
jgi:hypothetical protein